MFLIRMAFWVGLAVLLLPTDERQQARLYGTAVATVERVTTFCDRNAQACAAGAELWATFVKKAEFGARMAIDLVSSSGRKDEDARHAASPQRPANAKAEAKPEPKVPRARGTLTPADLTPAWRGQVQRTGLRYRAGPRIERLPRREAAGVTCPGLPAPPPQDHMHRATGGRLPVAARSLQRAHDARCHPLGLRAPRRLGGPLPLRDRAGTRAAAASRGAANGSQQGARLRQPGLARHRGAPPQSRRRARPRASRATAMPTSCAGSSPSCFAIYADKTAEEILRIDAQRGVRGAGPEGAPHAAALERLLLDGGAHPPRRPGAGCCRLMLVCVIAPVDGAGPATTVTYRRPISQGVHRHTIWSIGK